jgi:hypothetical protein
MSRSMAGDSLQLDLLVPAEVEAGAAVPLRLHVRNTSGRSIELYLRGRSITFDIVVTDAGGATVWRRLAGEVIPAIIRLETLDAGAALELRAEWRQVTQAGARVAPGSYRVHGELLTDGPALATPPATLRITR